MKKFCIVLVLSVLLILFLDSPVQGDLPPWPKSPVPPEGYYSVTQFTCLVYGEWVTCDIIPGALFPIGGELPAWIMQYNPITLNYSDHDCRAYTMSVTWTPIYTAPLHVVSMSDPHTGLTMDIQGR